MRMRLLRDEKKVFCYVDIVTETFSSVIEYVWESRGKQVLIGEEIDLFVSHAFEFRFTLQVVGTYK